MEQLEQAGEEMEEEDVDVVLERCEEMSRALAAKLGSNGGDRWDGEVLQWPSAGSRGRSGIAAAAGQCWLGGSNELGLMWVAGGQRVMLCCAVLSAFCCHCH